MISSYTPFYLIHTLIVEVLQSTLKFSSLQRTFDIGIGFDICKDIITLYRYIVTPVDGEHFFISGFAKVIKRCPVFAYSHTLPHIREQ